MYIYIYIYIYIYVQCDLFKQYNALLDNNIYFVLLI